LHVSRIASGDGKCLVVVLSNVTMTATDFYQVLETSDVPLALIVTRTDELARLYPAMWTWSGTRFARRTEIAQIASTGKSQTWVMPSQVSYQR
jgi:hypothetical protein